MHKSRQNHVHEDQQSSQQNYTYPSALTEERSQSWLIQVSLCPLGQGICLWLSIGLFGCGATPKTGITHPEKSSIHSQVEKTEKQVKSEKQKSDLKFTRVSQQEQQTEFQEPLPTELSQSCAQAQTRLYQKAIKSTQEYTQVFMQEIGKLKLHFQGFQLSTRRSQMMIFFGNGLIKRLSMIETISDCLPLYTQYLKDREDIFQTVEKSIKAQNH